MISFTEKGDFSKVVRYLNRIKKTASIRNALERYANEGIQALQEATPMDSGKTAYSWDYKIKIKENSSMISFHNSNINKGVPIAIILQYGHATGNGGWVEGRDYINPALRPVFEKIAESAWEEVKKV